MKNSSMKLKMKNHLNKLLFGSNSLGLRGGKEISPLSFKFKIH